MIEDNFYFIQSGKYKVKITDFEKSRHIGEKNHQISLDKTLEKNEFFGEIALLLGTQRSAQIESVNYGCLTALPG